jgi:hypothetical protein
MIGYGALDKVSKEFAEVLLDELYYPVCLVLYQIWH